MSMRVDWERLRKVQKNLSELPSLTDETNIVFIIITSDKKARRSLIKFKDFMNFLWAVSENKDYTVATLLVQDEEGRVLYRHKNLNAAFEEIPIGGNTGVVEHWNALSQSERDTYIRILESQIKGYEH